MPTHCRLKLSGIRIMFFNHLFFSLLLFTACTTSTGTSFLPGIAGYNEKEKKVFILPKKLLEISGHIMMGDEKTAAINDEDGKLFVFQLGNKNDTIQTTRFAGKGDYEDIVKVQNYYYILESNGDLHYFMPGTGIKTHQYKFSREHKIEFESLVHYAHENKLILITKDHRFGKDAIYAYSFDLSTKLFSDTPYFMLPMKDVYLKLKDYSVECKPSGASIHPILNKLFIIASVGKVLLQCSLDGKVEKAHQLNPSQFQQPEGISFASNGDMYISNEGLEGKATMLRFPYKQIPNP